MAVPPLNRPTILARAQAILSAQMQNYTQAQIASLQSSMQLTVAQKQAQVAGALTVGNGGAVTIVGGAGGGTGVGGAVSLVGGAPVSISSSIGTADTLPSFAKPDTKQPDTLGWRAWLWSEDVERLVSPHQSTPWPDDTLIVPHWDEGDAVRGTSGIHARLVPKNWRIIGWPDGDGSSGLSESPMLVTGVVERYGRYVLGTLGWRAEHVVIKELMAPSTEIGLAIEKAYPNVIVHYPDQIEGETPCKSVKSSELGKGSRPVPPSLLPQTQSVAPSRSLSLLQDLITDLSSPPNSSPSRLASAGAYKALGMLCRIWADAKLKPFTGAIGGVRITIGPDTKP